MGAWYLSHQPKSAKADLAPKPKKGFIVLLCLFLEI